jgi:Ca2+-binding RTX toxin-like protein
MMTKPINIVSPSAPATDTGWFAQDFGSPGQNWNMRWDPDLVDENAFGGVNLSAVLNPAGSSHKYGAAEIRSTESFNDAGGIVLSVSMRFPDFHPSGMVIGAFTFPTIPWTAPGTELDFEVLASGIQVVAHQYDGLGNRHSTVEHVELGFDPTEGFHTYEMALHDGVAIWAVDGEVVAHMTAADTGKAFVNGRSTAYLDAWPATGTWAGRLNDTDLPFEVEFAGADFRSGTLATPDLQAGTPAANTLRGDAGKDQLFGKAGNDILRGSGGDDRLDGGTDSDSLYGDEGADVIEGATHNDQLYGGGGDDTLDGGSESDRLEGGAGNDTYVLATGGDTVLEASGAGTDLVKAGYSITLDANLENLLLTGSAAADGTGNGVGNCITGNAAANGLFGLAGNDVLDGGTGIDRLEGGTGNDTYVLAAAGDTVVEGAGAGTDKVRAGYGYTLSDNVENLVLTGTSALKGAGNEGANRITGNSGSNSLNGAGGNDTMNGGNGADVLTGGRGADVLTGGAGADDFVFNAAAESGLGTQRDTVKDFAKGQDDIALSAIDANTAVGGNQAFRLDAGGAFSAGEIRQTRKGESLLLEMNTDGDSTAEMSVLLNNVTGLGTNDFLL